MSGARGDEREAGTLAAAGLLVDEVRRRLFRYVRRARRPVTREEAAASAGISRNLAAFHLDKLVEAGLLRAGRQGSGDRVRVGRRPKVYEPGPLEVHLEVPAREHALLAGVLVETLAARWGDAGLRRAATEAARRRGIRVGTASRLRSRGVPGQAEVAALLEGLGYEPYEAAPAVLRLANCPFQPLAAGAPELVCGLNRGLVDGLLTGLEAGAADAVLAPRVGECCVEIRLARGAGTA